MIVLRPAKDFADSTSLIHTIASIGRLAREDTSLLTFSHQMLRFCEIRSGFELKCVRLPVFWEVLSPSICSASCTRTLELRGGVQVSPRPAVNLELLSWTSKRSPAGPKELGSTWAIFPSNSSTPLLLRTVPNLGFKRTNRALTS